VEIWETCSGFSIHVYVWVTLDNVKYGNKTHSEVTCPRSHDTFKGNTRHPEVTWRIQKQHDPFRADLIQGHKMYSRYESAGQRSVFIHVLGERETLCTKVRWSSGKSVFRLYIQIRVVLVLRSNAGGERGALWEVQRGVPGVTSPGVTGWKIPRTGWESITVEGCGLLCALLRHTYEWVMSHIWMCHGTHMNESCHTYKWFLELRFADSWVMAHIWMSHVTHTNDS